ncbi:hypothetical protein [Desulfonema magnum]|uniref:Macrodomain effector MavL domain-containing protein n=1 Tax=Desulfonema magnum TaxID=45655 RepID=A0A975BIH8_9BACT|nr:hypothetical protein [Desulfonema magnum]QTA86071.1 Uncharacterized protein dnm_020890 [Desulfonema magnum]
MKNYSILINKETYEKVISYIKAIEAGTCAGRYLQEKLKDKNVFQISPVEFIELLISTKHPQIFAESAVCGDGTDWNQDELSILGDINIAVLVTVFDNAGHYHPEVHKAPFKATLLFIPGALLRNGKNNVPADWQEVTRNGKINPETYYQLCERRLLPSFIYANKIAKNKGKMAFITVPGLGCGHFAGKFRGRLGRELKNTLISFLENHGADLPNIKAVYYDPYRECENERYEINGTVFLVRPLTKGNENKHQLCKPKNYEEEDDEFADCELFSFVAWDHVSWPGNDFYAGYRATDDGVKAAATNSMAVMTGVEGKYDISTNQYNPPAEYKNWQQVILKNKVQIEVKNSLLIL